MEISLSTSAKPLRLSGPRTAGTVGVAPLYTLQILGLGRIRRVKLRGIFGSSGDCRRLPATAIRATVVESTASPLGSGSEAGLGSLTFAPLIPFAHGRP